MPFQFQSGAIKGKTNLSFCSPSSTFQFQSGAIKGPQTSKIGFHFAHNSFNSNLVQLKARIR